jgi:hypothetical protein
MHKFIVLSTIFATVLTVACSGQSTQANNPDLGAGSDSITFSGVDTFEQTGFASGRATPFNLQVAAPAAPRSRFPAAACCSHRADSMFRFNAAGLVCWP